jgi:amino acid permease
MELGPFGTSPLNKKQKYRNTNTNHNSKGSTMAYDTQSLTTGFDELENHNDDLRTETTTSTTVSTQQAATTTKPKQISEFDAIQHLIKGNLGPGCLNIPHAFAMSGWVLGLFLFVLVALQGIYSMVLLVYCKQWIRADQKRRLQTRESTGNNNDNTEENPHESTTKEIVTFMDVAYATHGRAGSICVQILLFILQAGVCCVFLSLIVTNLHASVPTWDKEWCVCLVTVLLLVIVLVRDLKELKWLSLGANCLMVTAILTAAMSALWVLFGSDNNANGDDDNNNNNEPAKAKKWTNNPAAIAAFVSSMFYSFEGIGLVIPVENSFVGYSNDKDKRGDGDGNPSGSGNPESPLPPGGDDGETTETEREELRIAARTRSFVSPVLFASMGIVALLFLLIGATCGPAFPDIVDGSVTAYLTTKYPNSLWYQIVNAGVMVAVFLTFPLQLTPAMEVLGEWFGPGCDPLCCGTTTTAIGGGSCCCGGGGLLSVRRRAGQRRGGRHTIIAQLDENGNGEQRGEGFNDEEDDDDEVVGEVAMVEPGDGLVTSETGFEDPCTVAAAIASAPSRNSCFGPHEWIFRRYLVVFGCALVVMTVDDLGLLMSLFGALGNTGLAAMPCLIHWKLMQMGIAPMNFLLMAIDVGTIGMSLGVAVIGVTFSVVEILEG